MCEGDGKIVAVSRGNELPQQFVLRLKEKLVIGRSLDADILAGCRGASSRHAEIFLAGASKGARLLLRDCSTNGTGVAAPAASEWLHLRSGDQQELGHRFKILVPFFSKEKDSAEVLRITIVGDALPDAYDDRFQSGRWRYHTKLGEGACGIVYQATDTEGRYGADDVAIKIAKLASMPKHSSKMRNAYILHREAQWSLQRLHNPRCEQYCAKRAALFAQYFEDHTGCWASGEVDFETERTVFEAGDFSWDKFSPEKPLPPAPYIAMELVHGRTLHAVMGWGHEPGESPPLGREEKVCVAEQAAEALQYLCDFGLIHRDFRTTNLLYVGRGFAGRIRVIDLGHTIAAERVHVQNRSSVVRVSWKEAKGKRFDWAPGEVKERESPVNFSFPTHAFDVFSFAVLALQLSTGSLRIARAAVAILEDPLQADSPPRLDALGINKALLRRMFGKASQRPHPRDVLLAIRTAKADELSRARILGVARGCREGSRSRSRSRDGTELVLVNDHWLLPNEVELLDDGYMTRAAYGSDTEASGSDTEPE